MSSSSLLLLSSLCLAQLSFGGETATDSTGGANIGDLSVTVSNGWAGTPPLDTLPISTNPFTGTTPTVPNGPPTGSQTGNGFPLSGTQYTTGQIYCAIGYLASQYYQQTTPQALAAWQAQLQAWSSLQTVTNPFTGPNAIPNNGYIYNPGPIENIVYSPEQIQTAVAYVIQQALTTPYPQEQTDLFSVASAWTNPSIRSPDPFVNNSVPTNPNTNGQLPQNGYFYTTAQIQMAISWLAGQEQNASGDTLKQLQAEVSAWTNTGSSLNQLADLQKSILNTLQSGQTTQISTDHTETNNSADLGQGLSELVGTTANVVTLITA